MSSDRTRTRYILPRAENILRLVTSNIISSLREGNPVEIDMAPLISRAYTIVNETGVIAYADFEVDTVFLEDDSDG